MGLPRYSYSYIYIDMIHILSYIIHILSYVHIIHILSFIFPHSIQPLYILLKKISNCARNTRQSFSNFGTELGTLLSLLAPEAQPVSRWDEKNMIATFMNIYIYICSVYYACIYIYIYEILYIYIYTHTPELKIFSYGWGRDGIMCIETCIYMCPHTVWAKLRKTFRHWRPEYGFVWK